MLIGVDPLLEPQRILKSQKGRQKGHGGPIAS